MTLAVCVELERAVCSFSGQCCSGQLLNRPAAVTKGTVMFVSLLVTAEALTCIGSNDHKFLCQSGAAAPI